MHERKAAGGIVGEKGGELFQRVELLHVGVTQSGGALQDGVLNLLKTLRHGLDEIFLRDEFLVLRRLVAAHHGHTALGDVTRPHFDAQRHALLDPFPVLLAAGQVALVHMHADRLIGEGLGAQRLRQRFASGDDLVPRVRFRRDGQNDDLIRCHTWRDHHAIVIAVRHDECADHARADAPARGVHKLPRVVATEELDVRRLGEVLTEVVRGAGLDCLFVLHHGFDGQGADSAGEALALRLLTRDHRDGQMLAHELLVNAVHEFRFGDGLFGGFMRRVAFLPEELGRAQEQTRAHLPAHHIGPLIDQQRQVAVALHPACKGSTDDRLRSRANDEGLGQFASWDHLRRAIRLFLRLEAMMRDDGALGGEALGMLRFLFEVAQGDEQREVGIHVAGFLEHHVELTLHVLPQTIAPRLDDHAAAHFGVFGHVRGTDDLLIPFGKILCAGGGDGGGVAHGGREINGDVAAVNGRGKDGFVIFI